MVGQTDACVTPDAKNAPKQTRGNSHYRVVFTDGSRCSMLCVNGESKLEAVISCSERFGAKFSHIE